MGKVHEWTYLNMESMSGQVALDPLYMPLFKRF